MTNCPFCSPDAIVLENNLAYARYDLYLVPPQVRSSAGDSKSAHRILS